MLSEISHVIRDAVVAGATVTTAIVAWRGLSAWRQQLIGNERHRIAKDLLRAALTWREAVRQVRTPMMFAHEMEPLPEEEETTLPDHGERYRSNARGYTRRWKAVQDVRENLETAAIEAEILFGDWEQKWFGDLLSLEHDLRIAVQSALDDSIPGRHYSESAVERKIKLDSILFAGSKDDEFAKKIEGHIEKLTTQIKNDLR